ncbi:LysM peptidoglycan-binding domain-containing protein [Antarctobacter heliothermus]|uniref:Amino acid ABC transporter substrate-binding protein, PAAT family n=1 Tax=Antarctobacter heliothermus TaxID=74033 RepID=A0A239B580_9RHOB|nr:transporter substrate-binding domain-containing protein [Antarctobacter heliothermus]SNS02741.1 amino acid ABC transporter substrate-binding protein, PAAT family [Antarctobacter heliothermus]
MIRRVCAASMAVAMAGTMALSAETCGGNYKVRPGDSLSAIADTHYQDASQWTVIYRNNREMIPSPDKIRVGQTYRLPCIAGKPVGLPGGTPIDPANPVAVVAASPAEPVTAERLQENRIKATARQARGVDVRLLAADDFRPFTNRLLMSSGLITDLVNRAFVSTDKVGLHKFYWVNDRSVHLDPMLKEGMADLAFPWKKPDCEGAAATTDLCTDYVYSEPMFEMLVVLFTAKGSGVTYAGEGDLAGLRVCSPLGFNAAGRGGLGASYLIQAGARLQQPPSSEECFARLVDGSVDAVAMNEFTGRVVLKDMGLSGRVELQLSRPLAIEGLHVVAHKANPRAAEMIAAFDEGLGVLRDSGEYLTVLDKHMSSIWAGL